MARTNRLRHSGVIPERQHDAFLLALLIAVCLNIAFFAIQSILPLLLNMLYLLVPVPPQQEEDVTTYSFEYVDPALLDEIPDPNQLIEAESSVNRRARQLEAEPDLAEGFATVKEGIDEYLTAPDGNPGENMAFVQTPGREIEEMARDTEDVQAEMDEPQPDEAPEMAERETAKQFEAQPDFSQLPPLSQMFELDQPMEEPEPQQVPQPSELAEAFEEVPPPPAELMEEPPPEETEPPPPEPDPVEQQEIEEMETAELSEEDPGPEPEPQSSADIIDLASLPMTNDGFFDPETRRLEELARRRDPVPTPVPQWRPEDVPEVMPPPQPPAAPSPAPSPEPGERRRTGRQPTFKSIGGASEAGGAPPRRNESTSVKVLDADASMALLAHRYGPYMRQVWEKLQASLTREMVISPLGYSRGQVKIRFGISADGTLTYQETVYPEDGSLPSERAMSERMLREAGPFDPLTAEMQRDELFQKMTVIVNLF